MKSEALKLPILICLLILAIDQITKFLVVQFMLPGMSISVIPDIFRLTFVLNPGAAFGILAHQRLVFIVIGVLLVVAAIAAAVIAYIRVWRQCAWLRYGGAMFLGGAVGNLIDRIRFGYVIDFFDFRVWPVFNIADIAIVAGTLGIMYALLRGQGQNHWSF